MKFNNKQRRIMRFGATALFCIILVLILDVLFNKTDESDNDYVGNWYIGYDVRNKETKETEKQIKKELVISNDGSFYTEEKKDNKVIASVSGTYRLLDDSIILNYYGKEKKLELFLIDGKLCMNKKCTAFFTKDKLENYFVIYNSNNNEQKE